MASLLAEPSTRESRLPVAASADFAPLFAHEPGLLAGVDRATADLLRHRARAPRRWLDPGPWAPDRAELGVGEPALGLLVLDGLLLRTVHLGGRESPELVGPGDLVRPWDTDEDPVGVGATSWEVVLPTTLAVLDTSLTAVVTRFPVLMENLLARAVRRTRLLAVQMAIAHVRHAETRVLLLLWHLAERWGRVTPDGVHLPLPLKHEVLAHLACMRRPTASSALARLQRTGELARRHDGSWLLLGAPPALGTDADPRGC